MRTPESVGISSAAVARLIRVLNAQGVPLHSLIIARRGEVVYEGYWAPYTKDSLHRMFSQTKSMAALAIGLLEADGKLSVKDPVCSYFPEYVPENAHPWLLACTIEDLLTMRTCYDGTVYTKSDRSLCWTRQFFEGTPTHRPGTVFQYDTSGTQVLGSLVEKLTGQPLLEFLKDRVFRRIGFSEESYVMPVGPNDGSMGGSGMMAKPMDMMRVALLLMNGGKDPARYGDPNAEQIYPEDYLARALGFRTSTRPSTLGADYGYGYFFWRMRDGFRMYGMASELTMCFPAEDIAVVTTADTQMLRGGEERIEEMVRELLVREAADALPEDPAAFAKLAELTATLGVAPVPDDFGDTPVKEAVSGHLYEITGCAKGFERVRLTLEDTRGTLEYRLRGEDFCIAFGIGRQAEGIFPGLDERYIASGGWIEENTFLVQLYLPDEDLSGIWFKMNFGPDGAFTGLFTKTAEGLLEDYNAILNG